MATLVLNTSTELSDYDQRTVLDGREYILRFRWNEREAKWYLDLLDQDEVAIGTNIKVVVNYPLNHLFTDERAPGGLLFAVDTSGNDIDPGLFDFGTRVILFYTEFADLG